MTQRAAMAKVAAGMWDLSFSTRGTLMREEGGHGMNASQPAEAATTTLTVFILPPVIFPSPTRYTNTAQSVQPQLISQHTLRWSFARSLDDSSIAALRAFHLTVASFSSGSSSWKLDGEHGKLETQRRGRQAV
jgi:hypothetical protein